MGGYPAEGGDMSDEAMEKAIYTAWNASIKDLAVWEEGYMDEAIHALNMMLENANREGFAAGYHARDAEVAELQVENDKLAKMCFELNQPELDDDTMRECVAREVMGWHLGELTGVPCWYANTIPPMGIVDEWAWRPDTNPAHTQVVKKAMRERGFVCHVSTGQYNSLVCFIREGVEPPSYDKWAAANDEGIAVCRAALLAVRA
jgi:hypothetical protein